MACGACNVAFPETGACSQSRRLMAHIPRVAEIDGLRRPQRHAMAAAAKIVQPIRGEASRVAWTNLRWGSCVRCRGPMARLAAHSELVGDNGIVGSQADRSGGVARKTTQDIGGRIENAIARASSAPRAWRRRVSIQLGIPALRFFPIMFRVYPGDEGDGLIACAEGPFPRLRGLRPRQRVSMRARRLRLEFRRVAFLASRCSGVVGYRRGRE